MLIIGITGKMGSGKSLVSTYLQKQGAYYIDMDALSKEIRTIPKILKKIKRRFGNVVFKDNELDTKKLRNLIFNNPTSRLQLNNIMWPSLKKKLRQEIKAHSDAKMIVVEAAILLQAKWYKYVNKIIYVQSDLETRIKRIIQRNNFTVEEIMNITKQQDDYEMYKDIITYQIINNDTLTNLNNQIDEILKKENL